MSDSLRSTKVLLKWTRQLLAFPCVLCSAIRIIEAAQIENVEGFYSQITGLGFFSLKAVLVETN